jgi:hypothetical protein
MPKADLSHYQGREEAYVKHYLLEKHPFDSPTTLGKSGTSLYISHLGVDN